VAKLAIGLALAALGRVLPILFDIY